MADATMELKVGRVYRAKRPAPAGSMLAPLYNDRQIMWIGALEVQYDGPAVSTGRHYPRVTREQFLKWAGEDVTDKMPGNGDWARWDR